MVAAGRYAGSVAPRTASVFAARRTARPPMAISIVACHCGFQGVGCGPRDRNNLESFRWRAMKLSRIAQNEGADAVRFRFQATGTHRYITPFTL